MAVSTAEVSIVNVRCGGLGSTLPARSVARPQTVYVPRGGAAPWGDVQARQGAVWPAGWNLHSKLAPASPLKRNDGVLSRIVPEGPLTVVSASAGAASASTAASVVMRR